MSAVNDLTPRDYYNCYSGGPAITNNSEYLRRVVKELPEEYSRRQKFSTYPNFQSKIIDTYQGYIFFNKSTLTESGLDLEQIARDSARHAMIGGRAYLLTLPVGVKVYPVLNVQPRTAEGLAVGYDIAGGDGKITIDLTESMVTIDKKGHPLEQIRYVEDMLVELRLNERGESLIRDTAPLNILIYNLQSILDTLAHMMLLVYPYGPPIGDEKTPEQGTYIPVNQGETVPGFAQPRMDQVKLLREEINTRIMQMGRIVGLESEFSEETTVQSGIARAYQMIDTTAAIGQIAREVANAVNRSAACWQRLTGQAGGTISINPIIHPEFKSDALREISDLLRICKTEEVVKWAQTKAVLSVAANELEGIKIKLTEDVKRNGGIQAMEPGAELGF